MKKIIMKIAVPSLIASVFSVTAFAGYEEYFLPEIFNILDQYLPFFQHWVMDPIIKLLEFFA